MTPYKMKWLLVLIFAIGLSTLVCGLQLRFDSLFYTKWQEKYK